MEKNINGISIPEKTVVGNLIERNKDNLNLPAIEYFSKQFTYQEFFDEIVNYARAFKKMGIKEGSVVTLCMPGVPEFILSYYALNAIGAVANGVSINFLKNNLNRYTDEKKSDTLIIFDKYYNLINDAVPNTELKNIIISTISDYMPERIKHHFNIEDLLSDYKSKGIVLPKDKNFIRMYDFIAAGKKEKNDFRFADFDENRDSTYLYSSGTTGDPKCIVFRDPAINLMVSAHDYIKINESKGDRSLLIIPPYYATSLLYAINLQLAKGKTLVLQPNYNKYTFANDLKDLRINHTVAAMSHYSTALNGNYLKKGDLSELKFPGCGGEGVPYALAKQANEALAYYGAQEKIFIGGGASELGSCVLGSYNINERVNETGKPLPGVKVKIVDPITKKEVAPGQRGELAISSPCAMDRYYNDPIATEKYFTTDEDGYRWGWLGDIAQQNSNGSYTMLGRKSDSFTKNNKTVYLFDAEEIISEDPAVLECEAVALPINDGKDFAQVIHLVLNPEYKGKEVEVINRISKIYKVDGIKIIDSFGTSEITGKRNTKILLEDREGFYMPDENGNLMNVSFPYSNGSSMVKRKIS